MLQLNNRAKLNFPKKCRLRVLHLTMNCPNRIPHTFVTKLTKGSRWKRRNISYFASRRKFPGYGLLDTSIATALYFVKRVKSCGLSTWDQFKPIIRIRSLSCLTKISNGIRNQMELYAMEPDCTAANEHHPRERARNRRTNARFRFFKN